MANWRDRVHTEITDWVDLCVKLGATDVDGVLLPQDVAGVVEVLSVLLDDAYDDENTPVSTPLTGEVLDVPYNSQHEKDAKKKRRDCGAAAVESVGEYYVGEVDGATTDTIMQYMTGGADRNTSAEDLDRAAQHFYDVRLIKRYNVNVADIIKHISGNNPVIVLVRYGEIPLRMDLSYTSGHWMTVVGYDQFKWSGSAVTRMIVHDPDWYFDFMAQGGFLPIVVDMFEKAFDDYNRLALFAERAV